MRRILRGPIFPVLITVALNMWLPKISTAEIQDLSLAIESRSVSRPSAGSEEVTDVPITYRGGELITTPHVFFIWYGNWKRDNKIDNKNTQEILRYLATNIGRTSYFNINTTLSVQGQRISGNAIYGGEVTDLYSYGKALSKNGVESVVVRAIHKHQLPFNRRGAYFVIPSSDVLVDEICTEYCGYHGAIFGETRKIRYAVLGNTHNCPQACGQIQPSPNSNPTADRMASVFAHELSEIVSDPNIGDGWVDQDGKENADKCSYTYGKDLYRAKNGAFYNILIGDRPYLLDRLLKHSATGDKCYIDMERQ